MAALAPALLNALQKNITTDMSLSDMKAIYDWGKNLPNTSIIRVALISRWRCSSAMSAW